MTMPRVPGSVSVVIGAYNAAAWIAQTLDSVLAQTYPVLEVIVIDDGSTDSTASIVQSYGAKVQYLVENHRGRPHRNRGILASRGEIVAFVDADDYWHPRKIEEQERLLQRGGFAWVICDSQWLDSATGRLTAPVGVPVQEGDILEALFLNNFIVASTPVVARHVFDDVGYFDETLDVAPVEDWEMWLRIAERYPVGCVHEQLVTLRLHDDSFLAATPLARRVLSLEQVVRRAAARQPGRLGQLKREALFNVYHAAGVKEFRGKRLEEARPFFWKAWKQQPTRLETMSYLVMTFLEGHISKAFIGLRRRLYPPR
jgi:glycosyltransferase involved in cell wall biosynthesis